MLLLAFSCAETEPTTMTPPTDEPTGPPTLPPEPVTSDTGTPPTGPPPLVADVAAELSAEVGSIVVVGWTQGRAADAHLEFSFDPGVWLASPTVARGAGDQTDLVLGVPYGSDVTWRLVVTDGLETFTSKDTVTTVGDLPQGVPTQVVRANDVALRDVDAGRYWFVGLAVTYWATDPWWQIILDDQDRVVWASRTPDNRSSMHARVALDQRSLYLDRNSYWPTFDGGASSLVQQVYIDLTPITTFDTPGLHHPFTDLPDGSVAYGSLLDGSTETIRIVHPDGTTEEIWDCEAWLASVGLGGSCASNTLTYDEATNKFLFSFYSLETIVEIDRTTGVVERWFGQLGGSYAFDPPGSEFWWQHGGYVTDAGTLLTSTDRASNGIETIIREYTIDDANDTLTEVWSFGIGQGLYGGVMGEPLRLPNGNTAHNYGGLARLREVTTDGVVVHDVEWDAGGIGRTMPIADLYTLAPPPPE